MQVEELFASTISAQDVEQLAALSCAVFPSPAKTHESVIDHLQQIWRGVQEGSAARRCYVARENGRIVASASITPRAILTSQGEMDIAGLCSVMCDEEQRGRGCGKAVVQMAFEAVDAGEFPWALFQTGDARAFYEKLGCCVIPNKIINSHNSDAPDANPLWEPCAMRYPCKSGWPDGTIDLLGPAY